MYDSRLTKSRFGEGTPLGVWGSERWEQMQMRRSLVEYLHAVEDEMHC